MGKNREALKNSALALHQLSMTNIILCHKTPPNKWLNTAAIDYFP